MDLGYTPLLKSRQFYLSRRQNFSTLPLCSHRTGSRRANKYLRFGRSPKDDGTVRQTDERTDKVQSVMRSAGDGRIISSVGMAGNS